MLVVFLAMIIGPLVAGKYLGAIAAKVPDNLYQPDGLNNNDTLSTETGTANGATATDGSAASSTGDAASAATTTAVAAARMLLRI